MRGALLARGIRGGHGPGRPWFRRGREEARRWPIRNMVRKKVERARDGRRVQHVGRGGRRRQSRRDVSRRRGVGQRRRRFEELLDCCLVFGGFKVALAEDMLRPKGEEELEVSPVHRACRRVSSVCAAAARARAEAILVRYAGMSSNCCLQASDTSGPAQVRPSRQSGRHGGTKMIPDHRRSTLVLLSLWLELKSCHMSFQIVIRDLI